MDKLETNNFKRYRRKLIQLTKNKEKICSTNLFLDKLFSGIKMPVEEKR